MSPRKPTIDDHDDLDDEDGAEDEEAAPADLDLTVVDAEEITGMPPEREQEEEE